MVEMAMAERAMAQSAEEAETEGEVEGNAEAEGEEEETEKAEEGTAAQETGEKTAGGVVEVAKPGRSRRGANLKNMLLRRVFCSRCRSDTTGTIRLSDTI